MSLGFFALSAVMKMHYYIMDSLRPLVLCGPSGSGKSTLLRRLFQDYPDQLGFSVSHTTRSPRQGEQNGVHYHFVGPETMSEEIAEGKFLETATFCGNTYGTSRVAVENVQKMGKVCVLDVNVQGVKQIKKSDIKPYFVFIKPPSLESLENRLRSRKSETEESLTERLRVARLEMEYGEAPGNFDIIITNDNLDDAYRELQKFVKENVIQFSDESNESDSANGFS